MQNIVIEIPEIEGFSEKTAEIHGDGDFEISQHVNGFLEVIILNDQQLQVLYAALTDYFAPKE